MIEETQRGNLVRLRTLVQLRWIAITGQTIAFLIAVLYYDLKIQIGYAAVVIGLSVVANICSWYFYPESRRLSGREAGFMLAWHRLRSPQRPSILAE